MNGRSGVRTVLAAVALVAATAMPAHAFKLAKGLRLDGFVEYEFFGYFQGNTPQKNDGRNEIQLHTEWSFRTQEVKAVATPEFRFDANDEERNRIFLDEAYVDFYTPYVDLSAGKQIISWGRADTIRPTDKFKIRDFADFFDDEEEGIIAAKARWRRGDLVVTGIWVPIFQRDLLPLDDERNRFALFPTVVPPGFIPGLAGAGVYSVSYVELDTLLPGDDVSESEGAIKVDWTVRGWDFSVSYAYIHDRFPTYIAGLPLDVAPIIVSDDGVSTAVLGLAPVYKRLHMIGFDGATTYDIYGFRWEAAYFVTEDADGDDPAVDDPYLQVTAGVDFTLTNLVGEQDLMILVQYANDIELPRQGPKNIAGAANLRHFFEHGILAVVEWTFNEELKFATRGFVNVLNADHSIEPEIEWKPADGLTLTLGGVIVGGRTGAKNSFFSAFEKDDRIEAAARYSF